MKLNVTIDRNPRGESCAFTDLFGGFEKVQALRDLFGKDCGKVLASTTIRLVKTKGYLRVDNDNGDIILCEPYLKVADERHFYLDLIHELVHVRQHHQGRELYDRSRSYVDRPTEIEAYATAVKEARRIGLTEQEIVDYLRVEWVTEEEFQRMLKTLGVKARRA